MRDGKTRESGSLENSRDHRAEFSVVTRQLILGDFVVDRLMVQERRERVSEGERPREKRERKNEREREE